MIVAVYIFYKEEKKGVEVFEKLLRNIGDLEMLEPLMNDINGLRVMTQPFSDGSCITLFPIGLLDAVKSIGWNRAFIPKDTDEIWLDRIYEQAIEPAYYWFY